MQRSGDRASGAGLIILVLAAFVLFFNDNVNIKDLKSILNSRSQKQSDPAVAVIQKEMVPREVQDVESGMIVPPPHSVASSDGEGAKLGQPKNAIAEPVVETFLAQALYNYDANPADKKEISFKAGEVFEVTDARGKWWKVRGTTSNNVGIAPSNFLKVLSQ